MKKLLTILIISTIAVTSIFAKSAEVQLVNNIAEEEVKYKLTYENKLIDNGTEKYEIAVKSLTEASETGIFRVVASSNMNSDLGIEVKVKPYSFTTTLNGGTETSDSGITPELKQGDYIKILKAGINSALVVNEFHLMWKGNADLTAGDYVSNVKIEYTII